MNQNAHITHIYHQYTISDGHLLHKSNSVNEDRKQLTNSEENSQINAHKNRRYIWIQFPCCCLLLCIYTKNINDKDACKYSQWYISYWHLKDTALRNQNIFFEQTEASKWILLGTVGYGYTWLIFSLSCIKLSSGYDLCV